ncbi:uncharacterized protein BYT42DRAFT_553252 [Radiomyces spectabilis]|uniref:uncharacterized protein n=1 Tax=Radiomyces spectabilis TaxID=64574 RepID=UPI00221EB90F|nr:uncharacterized protein BYT42DRAFT_553252 [Radiomyces spectabilis]KAI8394074.1 hypothetical protein BYT42DRAFT_553252 [Radiomyces spectabilis]
MPTSCTSLALFVALIRACDKYIVWLDPNVKSTANNHGSQINQAEACTTTTTRHQHHSQIGLTIKDTGRGKQEKRWMLQVVSWCNRRKESR